MEYAACAWRAGRGVCRCCLSEGCYKDIATEYYWMGERELYQDMLRECFDLTISYQDGGTNSNSRLICEVCITRLRDASNFKKQVINAEKRFAEHILTGSKLSDITEAAPAATFQEVKLEGVKDETGISDDDDMGADEAATDDPDYDPDYDESDMLPLKFEVQKKEALVEFSFGDEMPTLNTNETTIRRVSKSKGKSPSKKIKMSKKELTIKPIKASGSKVAKVPKAPKPAKVPVKKGTESRADAMESKFNIKRVPIRSEPITNEDRVKIITRNAETKKITCKIQSISTVPEKIIAFSNVFPFRWFNCRYKCFSCKESFLDIMQLREHSEKRHLSKDALKRVCWQHKNRYVKVEVTDLKCAFCLASMSDLDVLKLHLTTDHDKTFNDDEEGGLLPFKLNDGRFECSQCTDKFESFPLLHDHVRKHANKIVCDVCGDGFLTSLQYDAHWKNKHLASSEKYGCTICNLKFPTIYFRDKHKIDVHKITSNRRDKHKCPQCSERFNEYMQRQKHLVAVHGMTAPRHKCSYCERTYQKKNGLLQHVRTNHMHQRNYVCEVCGEKFIKKSELRVHMTKHGAPLLYPCQHCEKGFNRKQRLAEHVKKIHET